MTSPYLDEALRACRLPISVCFWGGYTWELINTETGARLVDDDQEKFRQTYLKYRTRLLAQAEKETE